MNEPAGGQLERSGFFREADASDEFVFLRAWMRAPLVTAAMLPSGKRAVAALAEAVDPAVPGPIVELGPGTGAVTACPGRAGYLARPPDPDRVPAGVLRVLRRRYPAARVIRRRRVFRSRHPAPPECRTAGGSGLLPAALRQEAGARGNVCCTSCCGLVRRGCRSSRRPTSRARRSPSIRRRSPANPRRGSGSTCFRRWSGPTASRETG